MRVWTKRSPRDRDDRGISRMSGGNFAFLQVEWGSVFEAAHRAESAVHSDARASCFDARRALELAVDWLFKHDGAFGLASRHH